MGTKFKQCILISGIIFLFLEVMSCSTDIDYIPPTVQRSLVVYGILKPDSTLNVLVTRTQDLSDKDTAYVSDATVKIYDENKNLLGSALYTEKGKYVSSYKISENQKLTIQVEDAGFKTICASDYAPSSVKIKEASFQKNYEYDAINDYMYGLLTLTFQDDPNEENFYEIVLLNKYFDGRFSRITPFYVSNEYMYVHNEEQNNPQSILFNDALFNGKEIVLQIKAQTSNPPYIIFRNTTETYYKYQNSLYTYLFTKPEKSDELFAVEPVSIYTNVVNGYGLIAGYNQFEYQSVKVGEGENE